MALVDKQEGNLIVSVPENRYFRFEESPTFDVVKSVGLSEVDFAWIVEGKNTLWLMELKDYGPGSPGVLADAHQKLTTRLPKNIAHAVLLVSAVWSNIPMGQKLRHDIEQTFPDFPESARPIRGCAIINVEAGDMPLLARLQDSVRSALDVFELDAVLVLPASSDRVEDDLGIEISPATPE